MRKLRKEIFIWLPEYIKNSLKAGFHNIKNKGPIHIMFLFVDHFEPHTLNANKQEEELRMNYWVENYPKVAKTHKDSDGKYPKHTWFYPFDRMDVNNLKALSQLCYDDYGEIELHLHHQNDTSEALEKKLNKAKQEYSKLGILITAEKDTKKVFGFVHGDWGLDNSLGDGLCGVNNELEVLNRTNCYADFTFPSPTKAQPRKMNCIYYAKDDPLNPKSYDNGIDVEVDKNPSGDLMLIQGPLGINWRNWKNIFYPAIEAASISKNNPPAKSRVDFWANTSIHVKNKPDWVFIKVHCHGGITEDLTTLLGEPVDKMFTYMEEKYNDGRNYLLHYVTAREAYNIIKAAEEAKDGNPDNYRDYIIKPYANYLIKTNGVYELITYSEENVEIKILDSLPDIKFEFKDLILQKIYGYLSMISFSYFPKEKMISLKLKGKNRIEIEMLLPRKLYKISKGEVVSMVKLNNNYLVKSIVDLGEDRVEEIILYFGEIIPERSVL